MEFNIMGIDPGSRNIGVTIFRIEPVETSEVFTIKEIFTYNLNVDAPEATNGIRENIIDRTSILSKMIKTLYHIYNPCMVAMESAFINTGRMGAVIPLARSIHTIESTLYDFDKSVKILSIPPGVIKKVFDSKQVGKDAVKVALKAKSYLLKKMRPLNDVTEHEIDSVAIAYTLLEYLKTNKGMVCIKYLEIS